MTPKSMTRRDGRRLSPSGRPQHELRNLSNRLEKRFAGFGRSVDVSGRTPARSRRLQGKSPVSTGELERLVHEYRRVHEEHRHSPPDSRARRKLETRLERIRRRFELRLAEAAVNEEDRLRWRIHLDSGVVTPGSPADVRQLLFRGHSDGGSELLLLPVAGGTLEACVDGTRVALLDRADELERTEPGFSFALDEVEFREMFAVPSSTLSELRDTIETGRALHPENVRELIADGLIDRTLGLTTRGRRALMLDRHPARREEQAPTPAISVRGPVPSRARAALERALAHVAQAAPRPVLDLRASITRLEDPALLQPVVAKAAIELPGHVVRAHVTAATETEAVSLLESRLHRNLRGLAERDLAQRHKGHAPRA